jgi:hypothetical protein
MAIEGRSRMSNILQSFRTTSVQAKESYETFRITNGCFVFLDEEITPAVADVAFMKVATHQNHTEPTSDFSR